MKAAVYLREPMDDVRTQCRVIERTARFTSDYVVFIDYVTVRKTRPAKSEILKRLRSGEFRMVMVEKLGSWANSSTELIREIAELTKKGITFISFSDQMLIGKTRSDLRSNFLKAMERFVQEKLNEKARLGIIRSKSKGKLLGRPKGSKDKFKRKNDGYIEREKANRKLKHIN